MDPDLGFALTVMRGHDRHRQERFKATLEILDRKLAADGKKDDFGLNRIFNVLRLIYEEG